MTPTNLTEQASLLSQFEHWATLEPHRCRALIYADETPTAAVKADACLRLGDTWITVWEADIGSISSSGLAIVLAVVLEAIDAHDLGCILHRSSFSDWEAKIGAFARLHPEPAIALLSTYLAVRQAARDAV